MQETFRERLITAMHLRELDVEKLSIKSKIIRKQIRKYIEGNVTPSHNCALFLAKALNVPIGWLAYGEEWDIDNLKDSRYIYAKTLVDKLNIEGLNMIIEELEDIDKIYKKEVK